MVRFAARLLIIAAFLLPFLSFYTTVYAASFTDINDPAVFLKQKSGDKQCTLVSVTMMIRRTAILCGDPNWASITVGAVGAVAWNNGLSNSFSYGIYSVINEQIPSSVNKKEYLIAQLKKHPEGLAIYKKGEENQVSHAVLLTDYTDGVFYCADPAGSKSTGRIPLSSAYEVTVDNITSYWHMKSTVVSSDGSVNPLLKYVAKPAPVYTPDPAGYKVSYSRILVYKNTVMSGSDVKYVQACLHYLGYDVTVSGKYDEATSVAVGRFQQHHSLDADCKCGPATWAALEKAVADSPPPLSVTATSDKTVVYPDEKVTLTAKANKSDATYQWYFKKAGQTAWTLWENHASAVTSSVANSTWNGIQFYCKAVDKAGKTASSGIIKLSVIARPRITAQPSGIVAKEGCSAAFSVSASGTGLKYQWYYKKKNADQWSVWNGHTTAVTTSTVNETWDGMNVRCKVTDVRGTSVTSVSAVINVLPSIKITAQPKSITAALGSTLTISFKATGIGLKYQWYLKKKGQTSFTAWTGRTGASECVTPNETWNGIQLYCLISDSYGEKLKTNVITVTLTTPKITVQPVGRTISLGDTLNISLSAAGTDLRYQWYYRKKGETSFTVWTGRTGASESVTPNESWDGISLYCIVKDGAGNTVKSDVITVRVLTDEVALG